MCVCVCVSVCVVYLVVQGLVSFQEASEMFCRMQHHRTPPAGTLPNAPDVFKTVRR